MNRCSPASRCRSSAAAGEPVRSGVVNAGNAFELRATATAQDSTYAGIVRLAEQAGAESAPIVRLADRYAAWFLPLALLMAGGGVAGERVGCASGRGPGGGDSLPAVARCAGGDRLGIVARLASGCGDPQRRRVGKPRARNDSGDGQDRHSHHGAPGRGRDLDRTGRDATEILRLAASVDQMSPHVLAEAIVTEALTRGLAAVAAHRRGRRAGPGRHRHDRRSPGSGRQAAAPTRSTRAGPARR